MKRNHQVVAIVAAACCSALAIAGVILVTGDEAEPTTSPVVNAEANSDSARPPTVQATSEPSATSDIAPSNGCTAFAPGVGRDLPKGANVDLLAFASFSAPATEADARSVAAAIAGVPGKGVECFSQAFDGDPAAAEEAPAGARDAVEPPPAGSGSCTSQVTLDRTLVLPKGVDASGSVDGAYEREADEAAVRREVARIANTDESAVECNFYVPPAGGCWVELIPPSDGVDLPPGATINGSATIDYLKAAEREQARTALADFARVDPSTVNCDDFSGEPEVRGVAPAAP